MESATTHARAGAAFLDVVVGPSWIEAVNLDRLDMTDGCNCVAGQQIAAIDQLDVYVNPFEQAMFEWGIVTPEKGTVDPVLMTVDTERARDLGFLGVAAGDYSDLRDAWVDVIAERVAQRPGVPA